MKWANRFKYCLMLFWLMAFLSACADKTPGQPGVVEGHESESLSETDILRNQETKSLPETVMAIETKQIEESEDIEKTSANMEEAMKGERLKIEIGDKTLIAEFADTKAAKELKEKLRAGSVLVKVSNYGGWEKVGSLPWKLSRKDVQTSTVPGDIMLYSGNSIVLFYGNNDWAYTRLGKIVEPDAKELKKYLGGSESEIVLSLD